MTHIDTIEGERKEGWHSIYDGRVNTSQGVA